MCLSFGQTAIFKAHTVTQISMLGMSADSSTLSLLTTCLTTVLQISNNVASPLWFHALKMRTFTQSTNRLVFSLWRVPMGHWHRCHSAFGVTPPALGIRCRSNLESRSYSWITHSTHVTRCLRAPSCMLEIRFCPKPQWARWTTGRALGDITTGLPTPREKSSIFFSRSKYRWRHTFARLRPGFQGNLGTQVTARPRTGPNWVFRKPPGPKVLEPG